VCDEDAPELAQLTALTYLNLCQNLLGDAGCDALMSLTGLQSLDLGFNKIGGSTKRFAALTALTQLSLRYNHLTGEGVGALTACKHLQQLDLAGCPLRSLEVIQVSKLTTLEDLDFARAKDIPEEITTEITGAIAALTALRALNLEHINMLPAGVGKLTTLTALTRLNLDGNLIGDEGAEHLAKMPSLEDLSLFDTEMHSRAAAALARLPSLRELTIGFVELDARGARALVGMTSLKSAFVHSDPTLEPGANGVTRKAATILSRSGIVRLLSGY
jgi:Leucine-rich repeat (LRR) protein